jgi:DEAD/DEAH box helicase domain-containing protein
MDAFIRGLEKLFAGQTEHFHHRKIPAKEALWSPLPPDLSPDLALALRASGLTRLYSHQAEAVESIRAGRHTAVVTPTASGKTLVYNIPVFEAVTRDPETRALYIFPIKALEQDQRKTVEALAARLPAGPTVAIYDGDTPDHLRRKIRAAPPNILITNPDMLHRSFLPYHPSWKDFYSKLGYVVLDELHNYKGVFGSHVAQVLRRLGRVAGRYGSRPTWVACSATIANPHEHAAALTGLDFEVVDRDGAPRAARHFVFLNPSTVSSYTAASRVFVHALREDLKAIVFTKARKITELIYTWALAALPEYGDRISSYRAGFLPSERREIEEALFSGKMVGVISTSALEMGIDIGGLDVCILAGYPGTIINTWQRSGRVGRGDQESLVVLVAMRDALDQYFMRHPSDFFGRSCESVTIDPFNPQILGPHLECAAAEAPLSLRGDGFDLEAGAEAVRDMERKRRLLRSADGEKIYSARLRPQRFVNIRSIGAGYTIFEKGTRNVIGSISGMRTFSECHEGAVYLHRGKKYVITDLDIEKKDIYAGVDQSDYYTRAVTEKETEILEVLLRRPVGNFLLNLGRLKVTEIVTGFQKRNQRTQDLLSVHPLELPPQTYETVGMWFAYPQGLEDQVAGQGLHFMGGLHAVEHAVIAVFPLFTLCDRFDLGGISTTHHPQVEGPAVFLYDGYPGGVGLCRRGFQEAEEILARTLALLSECDCEEGCPSCIHSPKCGSGNMPLDKAAAVMLLEVMLDRRTLEAASPPPEPLPAEEKPEKPSGQDRFKGRGVVVFDLETQRSARQVGGWHNAALMRVSVGVAWDSKKDAFIAYGEDEVEDLVALCERADLVVGFNTIKFDYEVLSGYVPRARLDKLPSFDILAYIKSTYDFRISLDRLAEHTLARRKTADGLQALQWWKEGEIELLKTYCQADTEITRDLFVFGLEKGYLLYERKGDIIRLPVEWEGVWGS